MRYGASVDRLTGAACIAALVMTFGAAAAAHGGVIPLPAEVIPDLGSFGVDSSVVLRVPRGDRDAEAAARYLAELWTRTNGLSLRTVPSAGAMDGRVIAFAHQDGLGAESYQIKVAQQGVTVSASTAAGLFYGAVTLWQLLPPGSATGQIPAQTIRDAPSYPWRGLMLDSARHFQSPSFIRSMIDWMAWHKLNVLHWHLTDDQGWRLEIRKFPRLTSIGAWRIEPDGSRYGGFYTQDEIRGIVRFAASRHVRIVPEIDMPGHATAAIAAYPALGAMSSPPGSAALAVSAKWGVLDHLFNLEPQTFRFLDDVLDETMALFPGGYVHVGGDEANKDEWNSSPRVQERARELGIHDAEALQAYFTRTIGNHIAGHGQRMIGWDEILRPGLRKDAVIMSWHGTAGAHAAAAAGNDSILTPQPTLYFDNRQSVLGSEPPGRLAVVSLEDVYSFEPRDGALSDSQRRHVLGVQANLWTEHMRTEERVQWMALPRAAALAEVGWSNAARRRWPDFLQRLVPMFERYQAFGLNYADSVFAPSAQITRRSDGFRVQLSNQAEFHAAGVTDIRYTLDGRDPSAKSARYQAPLVVPAGSEIRAAAFVGDATASRTWAHRFEPAPTRRYSHDLELCSQAIGLLLEPAGGAAPLAVDIMNPCWIDRAVDLSNGPTFVAAVAPLPFNYEIGADSARIRVGDSRTVDGELEVHVDGCDTPAVSRLPLAEATSRRSTTVLAEQRLPRAAGRHDLCLRFARPRLDPLWALDWVEVGE